MYVQSRDATIMILKFSNYIYYSTIPMILMKINLKHCFNKFCFIKIVCELHNMENSTFSTSDHCGLIPRLSGLTGNYDSVVWVLHSNDAWFNCT